MTDVPGSEPPSEPRGEQGTFHERVHAARGEFEHQVAHAREQFEEKNERIKQRTGRDLIAAILVGVAAGAAVVVSLLVVKWLFAVVALLVSVLGVHELWRALRDGGRRIDLAPQLAAVVLILAAGYFADLWLHWVALFAAMALIVVWRLLAQMTAQDGRTPQDVLADVLVGAFVPLYVPFLASLALVLLREDRGEWWILAFLIVAVVADTAAYASGLAFGRHPMAPRISPKKTWEGFAGAALGALVAGALLAQFMLGIPWWAGLVFGAVILCTATAGDLGESMIKRDLGIKDMSSALPGHGGVLDRLDSILPSAVATLALHFLLSPLAVS
ncbi:MULTISPECIES: phosphatidate cytidylyltransferase [Microbacterium]|uniref:Phosphatidate cytidylyltransferase n=1 Tax=Microbacterium barkeri TaxID=33917 RepID=A0A9W6H050_9MICO|nr:phosphatidate cytidylyltransferase [Microbacterium barkeri]MDI6942024.1 phosphatidate cytidylyltransferase [Microbacterium barkeri]MDR6875897.1 phosphatidate cytidylyltransferase [Microbacterium barkeri]GLJ60015.1 phosphatidate cytidylyltransferase [Microbacterium barkeri]